MAVAEVRPETCCSRLREPEQRQDYEDRMRSTGITVVYNGKEYTAFLEQGTYLMAVEFHPKMVGTNYIVMSRKHPLQLIYCAASDIASAGRDGTNGSLLNNIDFVYDSGGAILPVTHPAPRADDDHPEDPSLGWYPSNLLLQIDNWGKVSGTGRLRIHDGDIYLHRRILDTPIDGISTGLELRRQGEHSRSFILSRCGSQTDRILP